MNQDRLVLYNNFNGYSRTFVLSIDHNGYNYHHGIIRHFPKYLGLDQKIK